MRPPQSNDGQVVVFAKSPIQLALAFEACLERQTAPLDVVLLSRHGGFEQYGEVLDLYSDCVRNVRRIERWPHSNLGMARHLAQLAEGLVRSGRASELMLGADISGDSFLHIRLARLLGMKVSFVDNGVGTATTLSWLAGESGRASSAQGDRRYPFYHPYRPTPPPSGSTVYSGLPLTSRTATDAGVVQVGLERLRAAFEARRSEPSGCWILGQPVASFGMLTVDQYIEYLLRSKEILLARGQTGGFRYLPHPSEDSAQVDRITEELQMESIRSNSGVEFWIVGADAPPATVVSPYSSALCTLALVVPDRLQRFFWDPQTVDGFSVEQRESLWALTELFLASGAQPLDMRPRRV